jgi:hypothetical protein
LPATDFRYSALFFRSATGYHEAVGRTMNITGIFIGRPVMTTLVMLGIVLFGVAG